MSNSIFKNKKLVPVLAFLCAAGWSLAYPLIKLGYSNLNVASDDLGSKIRFAGIRFLMAGIIVIIFALLQKKKMQIKEGKSWLWLLLFAIVNISLHYCFSYVGLGYLPSSRSTILDSMNGFFAIILSCLIFADDKFTKIKALGCVLGFSGILLINIQLGQAMFSGISLRGDGMILLNALCGAFGGILTRVKENGHDFSHRIKHGYRWNDFVYHNIFCPPVCRMEHNCKININNNFSCVNISSMFWYIQSADCL